MNFYDILEGKFLVNGEAVKNWRFILFCMGLAIIMIACSHSAESKVHQISKLKTNVQELRSQFVDARERLMRLKMESTLKRKLKSTGIGPSEMPPKRIQVKNEDN